MKMDIVDFAYQVIEMNEFVTLNLKTAAFVDSNMITMSC